MGQEKSVPVRCNSAQTFRTTQSTKSCVSRAPSCTPSTQSITSKTSYKSVERQAKYLNEHLYIKSYLDIEEDERNARQNFQPAPQGIRNYTPKILNEKKPPKKKEVDVWI